MRRAGWSHLPSSRSYETLAYNHTMWEEALRTPGMMAYMAAQRDMRQGLVNELCDGTLDKWGRGNDCCKRAVLHYLNVALRQPEEAKAAFEMAKAAKDRQDALAAARSSQPIHGPDGMYNGG